MQVGDDFMVYLLKNTSIFLPASHGKHYQVGGPPISRLCFDMLNKCSSKFDIQHSSLHKCGNKNPSSMIFCDLSKHYALSLRKDMHLVY